MIINTAFALKNNLALQTLKTPLLVKNIDGSPNTAGPICSTTIQTIRITMLIHHYHQEHSEFYVTNVSTHDIILGTDWLKAHNPELNWTTSRLAFTHCPPSCILSSKDLTIQPTRTSRPSMVISTIEPLPPPLLSTVYEQHAAPYFLLQHQLPKSIKLCAKTTHSTTLATDHAKPALTTLIPPQFQKYRSVFSETTSFRLPLY